MTTRTGQFGVVRTNSLAAWLIRLGTRSQVNHAFVYVDDDHIVEAQGKGAVIAKASKYDGAPISQFEFTEDMRESIADEALALVGTPYGYLDILVITLLVLGFRWKWLQDRVQSSRTLICSQLVDRAYNHAGVQLFNDGRPDGEVTPGDLLLLLAERSTETV